MESMSIPNRINMSRQSADELLNEAPSLKLVSRGVLDVKGKGRMECFYVDDSEEAVESALAASMGEDRQEAALAKRRAALAQQELKKQQQRPLDDRSSIDERDSSRGVRRPKV